MHENEKPLVSVVVPIYNMGSQLKNAAKHIIAQTYENIEIILVDDGSEDETSAVCNELAAADSRIRYYRQKNMGSGPARNTGMKNANGKYVYFADADDEMSESLIDQIVNHMEKSDCDLAVFGFKRIFKDGTERRIDKLDGEVVSGEAVRRDYHNYYDHNSKSGIQGAPWNKMFRLDLIKEHGIEYPPLRRHQDEVFIMRYVDIMRRVVFVNDVLYFHNTNDREMIFNKVPKEYFEIVSELNVDRMKYIFGWNKNNLEMLDIISRDFAYYTGLALMYTFNPKSGYTCVERYRVIRGITDRFCDEMPDKSFKAYSTMFKLMRKKHYLLLYMAAYMALQKYY